MNGTRTPRLRTNNGQTADFGNETGCLKEEHATNRHLIFSSNERTYKCGKDLPFSHPTTIPKTMRQSKDTYANLLASPVLSENYLTVHNYYEKGPTAEYRPILKSGQDIESMLSKEEIFKI